MLCIWQRSRFFCCAMLAAVLAVCSLTPFLFRGSSAGDFNLNDGAGEEAAKAMLLNKLRELYGKVNISDSASLKDLERRAEEIRDTQFITHNLTYGPMLFFGNESRASGIVILSHSCAGSAGHMRSVGEALSQSLPYLMFVLPTAPIRHPPLYQAALMFAWYNLIVEISDDLYDSRQDAEGVMQSVEYIVSVAHVIGKKYNIPPERVVYAGLSQGGAISMVAGLTAIVPPAGVVSFCGYLPALKEIEPLLKNSVSISMFHGKYDNVVSPKMANNTKNYLANRGINVSLRMLSTGHQVEPEAVEGAAQFIREVLPS